MFYHFCVVVRVGSRAVFYHFCVVLRVGSSSDTRQFGSGGEASGSNHLKGFILRFFSYTNLMV